MGGDGPGPGIRALLRVLVPGGLHDELLGDLTERYRRIRATRGRRAAGVWIWWQVVRLKPLALRRSFGRGHGETAMGGWGSDLRHAARSLRKRPGFAAIVVLTVAVAVGSTTTVFSVVNGVLLRPLSLPEPDRLVLAWQTHPEWIDHPNSQLRGFGQRFPLSVPTYDDWAATRTGLESMGIFTGGTWVLQSADGAEVLRGQIATSGAFAASGVGAALGRTLLPQDDAVGAPSVALLSHELWRDRFGSDRDIVGRVLSLYGIPHTVVGVMPSGFQLAGQGAQLWTDLSDEDKLGERDSQSYTVLGRLRPGATLESLEADLVAIQERLGVEYPDDQGDNGAHVEGLQDYLVGSVRSTLWFLLGAVGLVLAIACVNLANMLSVAGLARRRELAVKAALGAGRGRLVRGMLVESACLGITGGVIGVGLTAASLGLLTRVLPATLPRTDAIAVDARVLAFGLLLTLVTSVLVGVVPALQAGGASPRQTMDATSRGLAGGTAGQRVRTALVVSEVAMAFLLLAGAMLLGTSFARLWAVDRGFDTEGLVTMRVVPDRLTWPEQDDRTRFVDELRGQLAGIPGTEVSATSQVPLTGSTSSTTFEIERADGAMEDGTLLISVVLPDYLQVMRIPLLEGRGLLESDRADAPAVAVVNQAFARRYFPGGSPVGHRVRDDEDTPWVTVVGVAADVRHQGLHLPAEPTIYLPSAQNGRAVTQWLLRVRGDLQGAVELARNAVHTVSASTPVARVQILDEEISRSVAVPRFRMLFVVGLSGMATLLALLGIYGVVAFAVSQRTRELAVRVALGARSAQLLRGTLGEGLFVSVVGVVLGSAVAWPATRLVSEFLFDVEVTSLGTWIAVAVVVTSVALLASWLPARRAARVDPVTVLSSE